MAQKNEYIPGVCNIGPAEIRARRMTGWVGLGATILLWLLFFQFQVPAAWRLALFLPATVSAVGFLQAAMHFCAAFGMAGVFNFGPDVGKTDTIEQAEYRRADRRKALAILLYSGLIGIAVAAAGFLLIAP